MMVHMRCTAVKEVSHTEMGVETTTRLHEILFTQTRGIALSERK
jgi:hypothetical protein